MKHTTITIFLAVLCLGLLAELFRLRQRVGRLEVNCAIAVLSAEAANNKVGAIAPYFSSDKEAFIKAWFDAQNLPLAVFPADVLNPIKESLQKQRESVEGLKLRAAVFKE